MKEIQFRGWRLAVAVGGVGVPLSLTCVHCPIIGSAQNNTKMTQYSACSPPSAFLIRHPSAAIAAFRPARGNAAKVSSDTAMSVSILTEPMMSSLPASMTDAPLIILADYHAASAAAIGTIDNTIETAATISPTATSFEAVLPDPTVILGMGFVVLLCIAASYVWANEVVPVSRTKLAISKSRGGVREYLDGLRQSGEIIVDDDENVISTASEDGINTITTNAVDSTVTPPNDGRDFERWLFSDWLNKPTTKGGRQKEPALPILREAKWNSGDNPVLVTAAM